MPPAPLLRFVVGLRRFCCPRRVSRRLTRAPATSSSSRYQQDDDSNPPPGYRLVPVVEALRPQRGLGDQQQGYITVNGDGQVSPTTSRARVRRKFLSTPFTHHSHTIHTPCFFLRAGGCEWRHWRGLWRVP